MKALGHERDININLHIRRYHGVDVHGTVKLSTYLRHRRLHAKDHTTIPHTHSEERKT